MALTISRVDERNAQMWRNTTGKPIYMNAAKDEVVDFGEDAAFLLVGPDGSLTMEDAKKYGLTGDGEEFDETDVKTKIAEAATAEMEENHRRAMMESGHTKLGPTFAPVAQLDSADVSEAGLEADAAAEKGKEEANLTPEAPKAESDSDASKATARETTRDKAVSGPERNK